MTSTDAELTYSCQECRGCGQNLAEQIQDHSQRAGADKLDPKCPLCRGSGQVTARELLDYYYPATD